MSPEPTPTREADDDLFARALDLSRQAHRGRRHEVAFHALTAALHAAHDARDTEALRVVAAEAAEQIGWIDAHDPAHRLSTRSAGQHQHPGVYTLLVRQATTHVKIIEHGAGAGNLVSG